MTPAVVGLGDVVQVVVFALLTGIGVTIAFSLAILGAVRSRECRSARRAGSELAWGALSLVALLGVLVAVVAGMWVVAR